MFTRFHDDQDRIQQQLRVQTYAGRYAIGTPDLGVVAPFDEDPHLRLQGWGANVRTQTVNLESDLLGLTRSVTRDAVTYQSAAVKTSLPTYGTSEQPRVEESRAAVPAWLFRDAEQSRWEMPWTNPQAHLEKSFPDNLSTRLLEQDYHRPQVSTDAPCHPKVMAKSGHAIDYYLTGKSLCLG